MTEPTSDPPAFGDVAPRLAEFSGDVPFVDDWSLSALADRDRSLITVASLVTLGSVEQLGGHVKLAMAHGLTEAELTEAILHLAFYAGWPRAMIAIHVARQVFTE
jgi:4-carboxymuconolactone decarboxylase